MSLVQVQSGSHLLYLLGKVHYSTFSVRHIQSVYFSYLKPKRLHIGAVQAFVVFPIAETQSNSPRFTVIDYRCRIYILWLENG